MAQRTGYHPGQGPDARFLSGDARKFVEEQIAIVDHLFPKSGRQYTDYNPNQYGEHEARRERRHGALSILGDQEALLEQALENHETLAQTRYRLTHAVLSMRVTERFAIRYTDPNQSMTLPLDCDLRDLRYSFVSQPMSVLPSPAEGISGDEFYAGSSAVPTSSEAQQSSWAATIASAETGGDWQQQPTQPRSYQRYPEINMVDNRVTNWWGYNDGVFSKPSRRRSDDRAEGPTTNQNIPPNLGQ